MSGPSDTSGSPLPLRPALRADQLEESTSPRSGPAKFVSIAEPEDISSVANSGSDDNQRIKQFNAGVGKRLTGRPSMTSPNSSRMSLLSQGSIDENVSSDAPAAPQERRHRPQHHHHHEKLLTQVAEWLQAEKAKREARRSKKRSSKENDPDMVPEEKNEDIYPRQRTSSQGSDSSAISLDKLQRILEDNMASFGPESLPSPSLVPRRPSHLVSRRRSSARTLRGFASSDTEYQDGDEVVPSCDVILDNSKTMSYVGGNADSPNETVTPTTSKRAEREKKAWLTFKGEIVRLAHTLRLKGWRRVPLERGGDIEVERLSGALTNAVYVVSPPKDLPLLANPSSTTSMTKSNGPPRKPHPPPKLLLRIYGPQVEHLIDRENELGILRRLARKKIGPRLLGTFRNGRFEEFFNAQTLTSKDLRVMDTSKQIAKRMRELHDGIELLDHERDDGPFVWQNWDKWADRCQEIVSYLDNLVLQGDAERERGGREIWRQRGFICGVKWSQFKEVVDRYRKWLDEYSGGKRGIKEKLIFAHNDTQYGNILRLLPPSPTPGVPPSPLLHPLNKHKQLVVIDFEYASANLRGLEFSNHFTEWCYNYHSPSSSWLCNTTLYPNIEEQRSFIRSYVNHRPQFTPSASATPKMDGKDGMAAAGGPGSLGAFMLDSRTPGGSTTSPFSIGESAYVEEEARREEDTELQVEELLKETRVWRVANSAQWVAWGIMQAQIPGWGDSQSGEIENGECPVGIEESKVLDEKLEEERRENKEVEIVTSASEEKEEAAKTEGEGEDEFDYLSYAQDRAMFFWGDVVSLGIVKESELPEDLRRRLKTVEF
ncbi:hypothetical protein B7494_g8509 [Chlorociboria aeruginascens]|nr:hypothetical protein B7494_g8509 [Chlorociboria aeruginascens]